MDVGYRAEKEQKVVLGGFGDRKTQCWATLNCSRIDVRQ
jgi:hypothetical protein